MSDRERRLQEALQVCLDKGNTFMAGNIRRALEHERKNPQSER